MICLLCLNEREDCINLFRGEGIEKKIADIVSKHFWLQAQEGEEKASTICTICWAKLEAFHIFYLAVEEAHKNLGTLNCDQLKMDSESDIQKYEPLPVMVCLKSENEDDADLAMPGDDPIQCANINTRRSTQQSLENLLKETTIDDLEIKVEDEDEDLLEPSIPFDENSSSDSEDDTEEYNQSSDSDYNEEYEKKSQKSRSSRSAKKRGSEPKRRVRAGRPRKEEDKPKKEKKRKDENFKKLCQEHDDLIAQNMKLTCDICSVPVETFVLLKAHYRAEHNSRGYAVCCGRQFKNRCILADHIRWHLNPEYFKCEECGKVTASRKCLIAHRRQLHFAELYRTIACTLCPKKFHRKSVLKMHMLTHMPDAPTFKCEECDKSFLTKHKLKAHVDNVHNMTNIMICDICGKHFKQKQVLDRHLLEHDGQTVPPPKHECKICGAQLKTKYSLRRHKEDLHKAPGEAVSLNCELCQKTFATPTALRGHVYYVHRKERKFKCTACDKAFKAQYQLKEHLTTHTGGMLYKCPHCPKTFNSSANMHGHRKKMHRKEWEENRKRTRPDLASSLSEASKGLDLTNINEQQ